MARSLILLLLVATFALPSAAAAQSGGGGAFGPLPQAAQATPEPTPTPAPAGQQTVSRPVLLIIAGAVLLVFIGIGLYITRDARRSLTDDDRLALAGQRVPAEMEKASRQHAAKQRARAAGKRQRQARKAQRRR